MELNDETVELDKPFTFSKEIFDHYAKETWKKLNAVDKSAPISPSLTNVLKFHILLKEILNKIRFFERPDIIPYPSEEEVAEIYAKLTDISKKSKTVSYKSSPNPSNSSKNKQSSDKELGQQNSTGGKAYNIAKNSKNASYISASIHSNSRKNEDSRRGIDLQDDSSGGPNDIPKDSKKVSYNSTINGSNSRNSKSSLRGLGDPNDTSGGYSDMPKDRKKVLYKSILNLTESSKNKESRRGTAGNDVSSGTPYIITKSSKRVSYQSSPIPSNLRKTEISSIAIPDRDDSYDGQESSFRKSILKNGEFHSVKNSLADRSSKMSQNRKDRTGENRYDDHLTKSQSSGRNSKVLLRKENESDVDSEKVYYEKNSVSNRKSAKASGRNSRCRNETPSKMQSKSSKDINLKMYEKGAVSKTSILRKGKKKIIRLEVQQLEENGIDCEKCVRLHKHLWAKSKA